MTRRLRTWLAASVLVLFGAAVAQQAPAAAPASDVAAPADPTWTVQVVALRDLRAADAVVAQLRALGFDAYTSFTMSGGHQWVRVRVGCATTRAGAERVAITLSGAITAEAVPVPREAEDAQVGCVERTVGFLAPSAWSEVGRGVFDVTVAGRTGRVLHDGRTWRILQGHGDGTTPDLPAPSGFRTETRAGRDVVVAPASLGGAVLCPGRLLADLGAVAIVEEPDAVVACRLLEPVVTGAAEASR